MSRTASPQTSLERGAGRLLVAADFPAPHGFSTRRGGVSQGVFAGLNFGNPGELAPPHRDPPANIQANFALVLGDLGLADRELVQVHQVHGSAVHTVDRGGPTHAGPGDTRADAIVTDDPRRVLAVRIADCAPVLLADADGRVVAAVHAGWRGVASGVARAAVDAMRTRGAKDIRAAIGPCIGPDAFEVGPEVAAELERSVGQGPCAEIRPGRGDRWLVDLRGLLARQLRALDVATPAQVGGCTASDPELYFSHRRERGLTGRLVAIIGPKG